MNLIFTKRITTSGNYCANFVFQNEEDVNIWLETVFPKLKIEYTDLKFSVSDLDGLKVGDNCKVIGDGDEVYKIVKLHKYTTDCYGFVLDSGWCEEVAKCYKE